MAIQPSTDANEDGIEETPLTVSRANSPDNIKVVLPTIAEYQKQVKDWPLSRIQEVARVKKRKGTAVPADIYAEARAIQKLYRQHKAMLAMMGNVSMFTLNKSM